MDHTADSAARYLTERGYTIKGGGRTAGRHPPTADIVRRWCARGAIEARREGYIWLISQAALDRLLESVALSPPARPEIPR